MDTDKDVAEEMAASRFKAPVIAIAPNPPFVAPPTIPLNSTSDVPTLIVNAFPSDAYEFTVPLKVILLLFEFKEILVVKITSPS